MLGVYQGCTCLLRERERERRLPSRSPPLSSPLSSRRSRSLSERSLLSLFLLPYVSRDRLRGFGLRLRFGLDLRLQHPAEVSSKPGFDRAAAVDHPLTATATATNNPATARPWIARGM